MLNIRLLRVYEVHLLQWFVKNYKILILLNIMYLIISDLYLKVKLL